MRRAAFALLLVLAACPAPGTPPSGGTSSASPPSTPTTRAGERGGVVRVAYPWEPPTLNPFIRPGEAPATRDLVRPLLPALWRIPPHGGALEPWLAASIPSGGDVGGEPFSVRVRLRPDAVWSDGVPITSADVRFTWQTIVNPRWPIASREGYERIRDVDASDPSVARIVFDAPFARWGDLFAAGLGVLPEHALRGKDFSKALAASWPVSGGPFVLASYTPGFEAVYKRSPRPWGPAAFLDEIRVQIVPDTVTALQLYRRGAVDVVGPYIAGDFSARAGALPAVHVTRDDGGVWMGIVLNTRSAPLADARTRLAFVRALDRAGIVEGLVRDEGAAAEDPFVSSFGEASAFAPLTGDAGAADDLLNQAGFKGSGTRRKGKVSLAFSLAAVGSDDLAARAMRAFHSQAGGVGFDINLIDLGADELWRDWLPSNRFQAALVRFVDPPGGMARARFSGAYARPKGLNDSALSDATLDAALALADREPAGGALSQAASRLATLVPVIPLWRVRVTVAAREVVRGVVASATADGMLWNCQDWWRSTAGSVSP